MFAWFTKAFCSRCMFFGTGPLCGDCGDPCNHPYAKATTPDQLISASVVELLAKDFDGWRVIKRKEDPSDHFTRTSYFESRHYKEWKAWDAQWRVWTAKLPDKGHRTGVNTLLLHEAKKIYIFFRFTNEDDYRDNNPTHFSVNFVPIDDSEGLKTFCAWQRIKSKRDKLEREAAEAKRRMEEAERKWNVAEDLLGMKRNEHGALVPKESLSSWESSPSE